MNYSSTAQQATTSSIVLNSAQALTESQKRSQQSYTIYAAKPPTGNWGIPQARRVIRIAHPWQSRADVFTAMLILLWLAYVAIQIAGKF